MQGERITVDRGELLGRLSREPFDLLVIGGGATGCGIALDAATRGLRTALLEREDFASGTSSRSTKLIHGGVRYLELAVRRLDAAQFGLVREALRERRTLLRVAPHQIHRLSLFIPLYHQLEVPYYWLGLKLYDTLAGRSGIGKSRFVSRRTARRRFPQVEPSGLRGGVMYYDGQFDDARMNLGLALTAIRHGAAAVNYAEVVGLRRNASRIAGAHVRDRLAGQEFEVEARVVVNACGPWADRVRQLEDADSAPVLQVSSGAHVVVDGSLGLGDCGMLIPRTEDGRVLFVLPWLGHTLIGTTEQPASPDSPPGVGETTIDYLLRHANRYLVRPIGRHDVKAAWSGLRPLVRGRGPAIASSLVREHLIAEGPAGLLTVTGGKWTTYRSMAEQAVDYAVRRADLHPTADCQTAQLRLLGGEHDGTESADRLQRGYGLDPATASHLAQVYGDLADHVAGLAQRGWGRQLAPGHAVLEAEVIWSARHELAVTAMDVLARRTRLAFVDVAAAKLAAPAVVRLLASELGWGEPRQAEEMQLTIQELEESFEPQRGSPQPTIA